MQIAEQDIASRRDNIRGMALVATLCSPTAYKLLNSTYDNDGVRLDLFGEMTVDGPSLQMICPPGTTFNLMAVIDQHVIDDAEGKLERDWLAYIEDEKTHAAIDAQKRRADARNVLPIVWRLA
ncbi:MAG: hypothetical protein JWP38_3699 [Herbaspirillum sp.]|nr:hypothetical protein [Herbaspirillum sp.]